LKFQRDTLYWLAAIRLKIGPATIRHGLKTISDIKALFTASTHELKYAGFNEKQIHHLKSPDFHSAEKDLKWCEQNHCSIITLNDPDYPGQLYEIYDAPLLLFVRGCVKILSKIQIAIVGSRNPSVIGKENAEHFSYALAKAGFIITSGFALGIDKICHVGAIAATGKTIAVFGTGLNCIYPAAHRKLADTLIEHGALISEFPPGELPKARNFPRRNRIISGLSVGVLVVEAAIRSGSLITARFAMEQNREVFAVPGSIHNPLSKGCHQLIQQGAKLVETIQDIIEELGLLSHSQKILNSAENPSISTKINVKSMRLLQNLGYEVTPLDVIIKRSGLTTGEVSSILLYLEMQGYVQSVCGGFIRNFKSVKK